MNSKGWINKIYVQVAVLWFGLYNGWVPGSRRVDKDTRRGLISYVNTHVTGSGTYIAMFKRAGPNRPKFHCI